MSIAEHEHELPNANPWRTLVAMTGSLSMMMLDTTVVGVALPTIQSDLDMSTAMGGWMVTSFVLTLACLLAIGGRLGDRLGRLRTYRWAVLAFAGGSLWCGMSESAWSMIGGRIVQGAAAACMQPSATAIVISAFEPGRRGMAMAIFFGISLLFLVAGPIIGGVVVEAASWPWIFWLNLPVAATSLALTIGIDGPFRRAQARGFDAIGALLLLTGLPALVIGLQWLAEPPASFPVIGRLVVIPGIVLSVMCALRCLRSEAPLLDLNPLKNRVLLGEAIVLMCLNAVMVGQSVYGIVYLQEILGWSPLEAGLGGMALMVPVLVVLSPAGRAYDKKGARPLLAIGLPIALIGLAIEVPALLMESYWLLAVGMALLGTGMTLTTTPCNTDALSRAQGTSRGEVSGLIQTMRMLGASLGVVLFTAMISIFTLLDVDHNHSAFTMHGDIAQRALQGDIDATAALQKSAPRLADSIRDARLDGIATAFAAQIGIAIIALIVGLRWVRTTPPSQITTSKPTH
ncbi:MAG: MFS transporter [Phycisphaerales bacterium]|nr:MFS transporter [Phycisphaerales bacterium]